MQPLSQATAFKKAYFQGQHIEFILISIPTPYLMRHRESTSKKIYFGVLNLVGHRGIEPLP